LEAGGVFDPVYPGGIDDNHLTQKNVSAILSKLPERPSVTVNLSGASPLCMGNG
jgi:hypothetical protein